MKKQERKERRKKGQRLAFETKGTGKCLYKAFRQL